jgi:hypothetical protein
LIEQYSLQELSLVIIPINTNIIYHYLDYK